MPFTCWETVLCLAVLLLLARDSQAGLDTNGSCLAMVQYYAVMGDISEAKKSDIFSGFVRVEDQLENWRPGNALLSWTFERGETILGRDNIFRDSVELGHEAGDIRFSSSTTDNTQSVKLEYYAGDEVVDIGFLGSSGQGSNGGQFNIEKSIGIPASMKYNDLVCEEYVEKNDPEFQSTENEADFNNGDSTLELEYLPIEFASMRFGTGHPSSFAIFAFRLTNNGTSPINLADVEVDYCFDGGRKSEHWTSDIMFTSACMKATVPDCSQYEVSVQSGLENVSGARYRVVIGFTKDAGLLMPNNFIPQSSSGSMSDRGPSMIEAIINITSAQFPTQMDVTKDYSFLNASILDEKHKMPDDLVPREYELNPRMPVYLNGKLVFGYRPKSSSQKAKIPDSSNQNQCWFREPGVQQCGIKTRYCCSEPSRLFSGASSSRNLLKWIWVIGLILTGAFISILSVSICFCYLQHAQKKNNQVILPPTGKDKLALGA